VIRSFGDKRTQQIFLRNPIRRLDIKIQERALQKLDYLDEARVLEDLRVPPSNRLQKKKGDLKDFYSIRVNDQWRIIFRWVDGQAEDVTFIDYH